MTRTADRVLAQVRDEVVVEYTQELVRRPSENPPGTYEEVAGWTEREFRSMGLDDVKTVEGEPGRINVVGRIRGANPDAPKLCLASHTDVVSAGDHSKWRYDPFDPVIVDGVMWGRGVADSKGMLAGMMAATRAIRELDLALEGDLYLCAYVDDETAGPMGLRHVFDAGHIKADSLVLGEATAFEIQYVFKSRIWFELDVIGRSAHGAFPERGINAIDKATDVMRAIRAIDMGSHPVLGAGTVNVGTLRAGDQVNVVAGEATVAFDLRWGPPMTSADVRERVEEALRAAQEADPELELGEMRITEIREPLEFPMDSPLIAALQRAGAEAGGREIGLGGWYSSGELWPVWNGGHIRHGAVIGPGEPWQAHAYDEHIPVAELVEAAKLYALTAVHACAPEAP
jgi:acetylornithine deacetylase/succinyl-diaminopimelate desuccinylase-like protein